jgi:malate synthase
MIESHPQRPSSTEVRGDGSQTPSAFKEILTEEALAFLTELHVKFNSTRLSLLARRKDVLKKIRAGELPTFTEETRTLRESDWKVAPIPQDIQDRRVEITGPVDRKMVINALNSGAQVFMADFEDSHSPTWTGTIEGQINLRDAVNRTIEFTSSDGKRYALNEKTAVLFVRPRGWHLQEKHVTVGGEQMSGSLFDFGLFFFHNAKKLLSQGKAPYFYLPKMESHLEARLWNEVFLFSQAKLGIPRGTIRATVLIETILASFEMDEILHELREHSAGLNCGRWDYIFSFIKKFSHRSDFVLPDRALVTMQVPFLKSYSELLIQRCHKRGIHAMGGMAAQIPQKNDPAANEAALAKVRADKEREARAGHDGTWVAHPGLVPIAREVFDSIMKDPNQITSRMREDVKIAPRDLLAVPSGAITKNGFRANVNIGLLYLESWLRGVGCVPLYGLMEDAATAEISRAQIWQWIRHDAGKLENGSRVTFSLFEDTLSEELGRIEKEIGSARFGDGKFELAAKILRDITRNDEFTEFLTLPAYEHLK